MSLTGLVRRAWWGRGGDGLPLQLPETKLSEVVVLDLPLVPIRMLRHLVLYSGEIQPRVSARERGQPLQKERQGSL